MLSVFFPQIHWRAVYHCVKKKRTYNAPKSTLYPRTDARIRELQSCPFLQRTRPDLTAMQTLPDCYLQSDYPLGASNAPKLSLKDISKHELYVGNSSIKHIVLAMFPKNPSTEGNQQIQATLDILKEESNDTYYHLKNSSHVLKCFVDTAQSSRSTVTLDSHAHHATASQAANNERSRRRPPDFLFA